MGWIVRSCRQWPHLGPPAGQEQGLPAQGPTSPTCLEEHGGPPLPLLLAAPVSPPATLNAAGTLLQHLGTPAFQKLQLGEGACTEVLSLSSPCPQEGPDPVLLRTAHGWPLLIPNQLTVESVMNTLVLPQCTGAGVASAGARARAGRVWRMSWRRACSVACSECGDHSGGRRQRSHQCFIVCTLLWP